MANRPLRSLDDFARADAHIGVTCRGCGRYVVMQRQGVLQWFQEKCWNTAVEVAGEHFRCRKCGHRGATIRPVAFSERRPLEPPRVLWER